MQNVKEISSNPEQLGIARLLTMARQQGTEDSFPGKRRWKRYALGMGLEVTSDLSDPGASWNVVMHNVSGGGFGFWSKKRVRDGEQLFVRSRTKQGHGEWLAAEAAHCVVGIKGYLIGARFVNPIAKEPAPQKKPASADAAETETDEIRPTRAMSPRTSLRVKGTLICGVSATVGAVPAIVIAHQIWPEGRPVWLGLLFVAAAFASLLSWGGMSILLRRDNRFLREFQSAIRGMAEGSPNLIPLLPAASTELDMLRQTFLDLRTAWQKRQDADRLQRQKLEELNQIKSNILSIVSHDLRTPMTSILLYAKMLDDELDSLAAEDQRKFLKIIAEECTRLSRLVDDLLEVQRLESGRAQWDLRPRDLTETILACVSVFEAMALSKSIELTADCPKKLPLVEADSDKISQVLSNLLSNALKYTPAGGKVHLEATANASEIMLRVADSGPGIPRDKWDQIFDRFAQLSNHNVREISGVGLGLYIVRQIVERHGGTVWVDSREGGGSEFFVSLPTRSTMPEPDTSPAAPVSAGRVVVCDADPQLASMIAHTLRLENYDVRLAHSGCRMLAHLSRGDVDVVVTDVLLPDMHATELLDAINEISPRTFRLIVHSYAGDGPDMRRRGVDIVLARPATEEELRQATRLAMQGHSAGGLGIVLVRAPSMDMRRFKQMIADAGHTPIVAESLAKAAEVIRHYPVHVVLVSNDSLQNNWSNLQKLDVRHEMNVRVMVLLDKIRRRERHLATAYGVTAQPYLPGDESQVLQAITQSESAPVPEYT